MKNELDQSNHTNQGMLERAAFSGVFGLGSMGGSNGYTEGFAMMRDVLSIFRKIIVS